MPSPKNSTKLLKQARENEVFSLETGYLRVPKTLTSIKKTLLMKMSFICMRIKMKSIFISLASLLGPVYMEWATPV